MTSEEKARLRAQFTHRTDEQIDQYEQGRKIIDETMEQFAGNPQYNEIKYAVVDMIHKHFNLKPV